MAQTPTTMGEIFDQEESILDRRRRVRREAEQAFAKTPEGIAENERLTREREERMARHDAALETADDSDDFEDGDDDDAEDECE